MKDAFTLKALRVILALTRSVVSRHTGTPGLAWWRLAAAAGEHSLSAAAMLGTLRSVYHNITKLCGSYLSGELNKLYGTWRECV